MRLIRLIAPAVLAVTLMACNNDAANEGEESAKTECSEACGDDCDHEKKCDEKKACCSDKKEHECSDEKEGHDCDSKCEEGKEHEDMHTDKKEVEKATE